MEREIKFRAIVIDDDGKERLEYNVWPTGPSPGMRHLRGFIDNGGLWMDCKKFEQFTGLKDKNGKEIYEGDIFVSNFGTKFLVEWYPRDCRFAIVQVSRAHVPKFQGEYFTMFIEMSIETEVIGNIYENPDLL